MDIKLKARLSAYSKLGQIDVNTDSIHKVSNEEIDKLFKTDENQYTSVSNEEIDPLFK